MKSIIIVLLTLTACGSKESSDDTSGQDGAQGPVGPQGPAGERGATGPQGPAGSTGATGAQGVAGLTGSQGVQGTTGPQGPAGPSTGVPGPQGPQGATGATGAQGMTGPQGATGARGPAGAQSPMLTVFTRDGVQLGVLLDVTPGHESYMAYGDAYTHVPDGLILHVSQGSADTARVYYTNNDCTGTAYIVESNGYVFLSNTVYAGYNNTLYTALDAVASTNLVVQSFSTGGGSCTASSFGAKVHAAVSVGTADLRNTIPWHAVIQ